MFHSARLKLTLWYLLIIMIISLAFSAVIFRMLSTEVMRFARLHRYRLENNICEKTPLTPEIIIRKNIALLPGLETELINETKRRLLVSLAFLNGGILIAAGTLGYILAGRTLQPIQDMMDDQHRFISDSSHELRTPLTSLRTALEVSLRDPRLNLKEAKKLIQESITEVNKLQALADGLLQLAQYERPNGHTLFEKIDVPTLLHRAVQKVTPLAKNKHITIKEKSQPLEIMGNVAGLQELLVILLDNAVKYSRPKSTIMLSAQRVGKTIKIIVNDEGRGIDQKDIHHIFDRFYRADAARSKTETTGYGLGLSIAYKIVSNHHGSIKVSSQPDKGSTFTVTLPLSP